MEEGTEVWARYAGAENLESAQQYLEALDPELHRYIRDFVFGDVYADDTLDPKTRALITVAMLTALDQPLQLAAWTRHARNAGASEEELRALFRQAAVYAGFPRAWNGIATMKRALADFEPSAPGA
jgi:4-carboxymuconolactone decarboxylase